uniref:RecA family profile 1 domain-containing protein n=1 Tax=Periophthalmus magnuspinnatus TaxID=409849 RepID=A0A3B4B055_9GOBI
MVVLRAHMCPGLELQLVRDLRECVCNAYLCVKALLAIRRVLLAQHTAFPVSGADLYEDLLSSTAILSTGHPRLDELLDSGLYTGELTELSGGPGTGKTQVCFGVAVHIALHLKQGVIFIDTTGGITATRLHQMLQTESSSLEEQIAALQRIHVFQLFDVFSLLDCLCSLRRSGLQPVAVGGACVRAVIIDSVSAVISPLLGTRHTEGMSLMMQVAALLKALVKDFSVAALVTNHVTRSVGGAVRPALGVSWSHLPRTRLLLEGPDRSTHSFSSLRSATLIKSSRQPCHMRVEFDLSWWSRSKEVPSAKRKHS